MRNLIPQHLIAIVSELVALSKVHSQIDSLLMYAGAPGDPPQGSKPTKVQEWLRRTNKDEEVDPLQVLAFVLEEFMEDLAQDHSDYHPYSAFKKDIEQGLQRAGLKYLRGLEGPRVVNASLGTPTSSLEDLIRNFDVLSINQAFSRAVDRCDTESEDAILSACNILESICAVYIEDENLPLPNKKDLQNLWKVVKDDLGFDPASIVDQDLLKILSGMFSILHGVSALRTHRSSAHGGGRTKYKIEGRHARLAVHSAHTLAAFILETWGKKREQSKNKSN